MTCGNTSPEPRNAREFVREPSRGARTHVCEAEFAGISVEQDAYRACARQGKHAYIRESHVNEGLTQVTAGVEAICVGPDSSLYLHPGLQVEMVDSLKPPGAEIRRLYPGSRAIQVGLAVGDVIIAIDGLPVARPHEVSTRTEGLLKDTTVAIRVHRGDRDLELKVSL